MKNNRANALMAARSRLARAYEDCAHWDYEDDGGDEPCCRELRAAHEAVRARREERRAEAAA